MEETAQTSHVAVEHEAHGHSAQIDPISLGASIVNFGVLVAVLVWLLKKPLSDFLKQRKLSVVEALSAARKIEEEAEAKKQMFDQKLAGLEQELIEMRRDLLKAAEAERDRIVAEAEYKTSVMRQEAKFLVEQELKQLRQDILNSQARRAVDDAQALLMKQISEADHERLAKAFLEDLRALSKQKVGRRSMGPASMPPISGGRSTSQSGFISGGASASTHSTSSVNLRDENKAAASQSFEQLVIKESL